jgi:hypothetical protein
MKQTAVEWLKDCLTEQYPNGKFVWNTRADIEGLFKQAKRMEKQQQGYSEEDVKNAFLDGWQLRDGDLPFPKAKKEWFEQFKKK